MDLKDIQETSAASKSDADSALGIVGESEQSAKPLLPPKLPKPKVLKPVIWLVLTLASVFFVAALNFMPMFYWLPPGLGETQFDAIGLRATILKNIDQNSVVLEQFSEPEVRVQLLDLPGRHTDQQTLHTQFGDQLDNRIVIAVLRRDTQARELLDSGWF